MRVDYAAAQARFAAYDALGPIGENGPVWHGPIENCDVCSRPMDGEMYMIDGPAQAAGGARWGNLCVVCAAKSVPTIGWGKAQLYRRQGVVWHLVAGGPPSSYAF